jgi:hypothetical protein
LRFSKQHFLRIWKCSWYSWKVLDKKDFLEGDLEIFRLEVQKILNSFCRWKFN